METQVTEKKAPMSIQAYLTDAAVKEQINKVVGGTNGDRFISSLMSAVQANKSLMECTNASLVNAALLGFTLKLSPSPQLGQFYMVPYKHRTKTKNQSGKETWNEITEAQFQLGYKGMLQLAMRSGNYRKINALPIKAGELVKYDPLFEEIEVRMIEDPDAREKAETVGYFATFEYVNGFRKSIYWSREKMEQHADRYSAAFQLAEYQKLRRGEIPEKDMWKYSSFWYKDFDGMAVKTMLRQLISHWGVMSIDMEKGYGADEAVVRGSNNYDYVDMVDETEKVIEENANQIPIDIAEEEPQKPNSGTEEAQTTKPSTEEKTITEAEMGF